jgi:hypothetical protein
MPADWWNDAHFQHFLDITREHNALLCNPFVNAIELALRRGSTTADLPACLFARDCVEERRTRLFRDAKMALNRFAEATDGSVLASAVDEYLASLQTETYVVRLLACPVPAGILRRGVVAFCWGSLQRSANLWFVMARDTTLLREDASRFGYDWADAGARARARRDLDGAGFGFVRPGVSSLASIAADVKALSLSVYPDG